MIDGILNRESTQMQLEQHTDYPDIISALAETEHAGVVQLQSMRALLS